MILKYKNLIETNPVAFASVDKNNKPNVIGVAYIKVIDGKNVLITDNYMNKTKENLTTNNNVCLAIWDKKWKGIKIIGKAKYYTEGKYLNLVKELKENKGLPSKGAILIKVSKLIELK